MDRSKFWAVRREARRLTKRGLCLGEDRETGERIYLPLGHLGTHLYAVGTTGSGKTMLQAWIVALLAEVPDASVIVLDPKGDIVTRSFPLLVANGHTERITLFDPRIRGGRVIGFNPLRPNGLAVMTHAKMVKEALLAASGQVSVDQTPQLSRHLLTVLAAARANELTLVEALDLLRPDSAVRRVALSGLRVADLSEVRKALIYFDSLSARRQDELGASTMARIEPFISDPLTRRILTRQERALDFGKVMREGEIVLVNFAKYQVLPAHDCALLGRLLVNDVLAHAFARSTSERRPVFLVIDEAQNFSTPELAEVLSEGRSLGLHLILAHQYPAQFEEAGFGTLFRAVTNCARTKVVFGLADPDDLKFFARVLFLDQYEPRWATERFAKVSVAMGRSVQRGVNFSHTHSFGSSESRSQSEGRTTGRQHGVQLLRGYSEGWGSTWGSGESSGTSQGSGLGEVELPSGEIVPSEYLSLGATVIGSSSFGESVSEAHHQAESVSSSRSTHRSEGTQRSSAHSTSEGTASGASHAETIAQGETREPLSEEGFLALAARAIREQKTGEFIVQAPNGKARFLRAPRVRIPVLGKEEGTAAVTSIFTERSCYSTIEEAAREDTARERKLLRADRSTRANALEPISVWAESIDEPKLNAAS